MSLALALFVATSSGLLVGDAGVTPAARADASLEDALRAGGRSAPKAKRALALALASDDATAAQTWRALRQVAKHDAAVAARLDGVLPAIPFVEANGAQARALGDAFEQALVDTRLPLTADPARRKGELKVTWTMRLADDERAKQRAWSVESKASLVGKDGKARVVKAKTLVTGSTAEQAARDGLPRAAEELAKALLVAVAKDGVVEAVALRASPRTIEKVEALKERARDDARSQAVLDAFPAAVSVDVAGTDAARVWEKQLERALVGVSQGALPLVTTTADHTMQVRVVVEETGGKVLAAGSVRRYTLKATAKFVYDDGAPTSKVLAQIAKVGSAVGSTPEEAAAGADKLARSLYDAMVDEVSALRHRRLAAR